MAIPAFAGMTDMGHFALSRSAVIIADILLVERYLRAGAQVLALNGKPFDAPSNGSAIATRAIMEDLRRDGRSGRRSAAVQQGGSVEFPAGTRPGAGEDGKLSNLCLNLKRP